MLAAVLAAPLALAVNAQQSRARLNKLRHHLLRRPRRPIRRRFSAATSTSSASTSSSAIARAIPLAI
jgi:hypothetical protein